MYQVNFSDQSMRELNKLEKLDQLVVLEPLSNLSPQDINSPREPLGRFHRDGHEFFRLRSGEYRIYFQVQTDMIQVQYILHSRSLTDFVFRTKLPVSEQTLLEDNPTFWTYIESLKK